MSQVNRTDRQSQRFMRWSACTVLLWMVGASWLDAQGGPPYYTNDPATPGDLQWEINLAYMPLVERGQSTTRMPDLDINLGVGDRIQLTFEVPWLRVAADPTPAKSGLGQDVIGVKWRFYDDRTLAASVFPQASINNPTRSVERGIVPPGASLLLPLEMSRSVGPITVNAEVGYSVVRLGPDGWLCGIVAGHERRIRPYLGTIEFDAEYFLTGDVGGSVTQETLGGGLRYQVRPSFVLLVMAGRSVPHSGGSFAGYGGVQLRLRTRRRISE